MSSKNKTNLLTHSQPDCWSDKSKVCPATFEEEIWITPFHACHKQMSLEIFIFIRKKPNMQGWLKKKRYVITQLEFKYAIGKDIVGQSLGSNICRKKLKWIF